MLNPPPNAVITLIHLVFAYGVAGGMHEAQAEAEEVLKINLKFSLEDFAETLPHKNKADKNLAIEALRKAGLKWEELPSYSFESISCGHF